MQKGKDRGDTVRIEQCYTTDLFNYHRTLVFNVVKMVMCAYPQLVEHVLQCQGRAFNSMDMDKKTVLTLAALTYYNPKSENNTETKLKN